jgi:hypothetical protein
LTDPKAALRSLLESSWGVSPKPRFTVGWYEADEKMPQISVTHSSTQLTQLGFSEGPPERRFRGILSVDVWVKGDQEVRHRLVREADRVIRDHASEAEGIEHAWASGWRDLDEPGAHPRLLRSQLSVEVLYYG